MHPNTTSPDPTKTMGERRPDVKLVMRKWAAVPREVRMPAEGASLSDHQPR